MMRKTTRVQPRRSRGHVWAGAGSGRMVGLAVALVLVAAACGGDDGDGAEEDPAGDAASNDVTNDAAEQAADVGEDELAASVADGWVSTVVGSGIKPVLALDGDGAPAIASLQELTEGGYVAFESSTDGWERQVLAEGYFYGPIGLAFDPDDQPHVVWHDHEAIPVEPELGNLAYAAQLDGEWQVETVAHDGHDGWDSTIVVGEDGVVRAAGIDPAQFNPQGRDTGVEYYELAPDGTWTVENVGSGLIEYEFNVGLAIAPDGHPGLSWSDMVDPDNPSLHLAERIDGEWQIETVPVEGGQGLFSSLTYDSQGRPHLAFYQAIDDEAGRVLYGVRDDGQWSFEEVGTLDAVELGMAVGARRNAAIALGPDDDVQVAYTDKSALLLATRDDDGAWNSEEVLAGEGRDLGQLVSFERAADGTPHLATYEVTGRTTGGLAGLIVHLTPG